MSKRQYRVVRAEPVQYEDLAKWNVERVSDGEVMNRVPSRKAARLYAAKLNAIIGATLQEEE